MKEGKRRINKFTKIVSHFLLVEFIFFCDDIPYQSLEMIWLPPYLSMVIIFIISVIVYQQIYLYISYSSITISIHLPWKRKPICVCVCVCSVVCVCECPCISCAVCPPSQILQSTNIKKIYEMWLRKFTKCDELIYKMWRTNLRIRPWIN